MRLRNRFVLPFALSFLAGLAGCGSSSPTATPPPTGGFTNSNLKGTYVFSTSGTDVNGAPIAIVGSFTACGCTGGTISGGTIDANDSAALSAPISLQSFSSGTYSITADGRGQAQLSTGSGLLGTVTLDFVLASPSGGLVTEFDDHGTGSGTLDLQTSTTQSQLKSYAFELAGADGNGNTLQTAGAFSLNGSTAISSGVQDINYSGITYVSQALAGSVTLGSGGTTGSVQVTTAISPLTFDFYVIDATHLKLIESDTFGDLSGDAFSQATAAIPAGTMSFTLAGLAGSGSSSAEFAGGGFMASDGNGNILNSSNEDVVEDTTTSPAPVPFSGNYVFNGPRATLTLSGLTPGSNFAAYPSSGGLLLIEVDSSGTTTGAALAQSSTSLAASQGYALNLTAFNESSSVEVDDIAEFTAASATSNPNVTGLIDENYDPGGTPIFDKVLTGTYTAPDSSGRGTITAPSEPTINGGFGITFYAVDGSNFLFIENDGTGQVGVGSFAVQSGTSGTPNLRHPMMRVPRLLGHGAEKRATKKKQN